MKSVYLVHGFNVKDNGLSTILRLIPYFITGRKDLRVYRHSYGWLGLLGVILHNRGIAAKLAARVFKNRHSKDCQVFAAGHSNGCAILVEAARRGAVFERVLLINPALKIDMVFPESMKKIFIIYTRHDEPTLTARILDNIPFIGLLIPNAWGAMGRYGSEVVDSRVTNINLSYALDGHSALFTQDNLDTFAKKLASMLLDEDATKCPIVNPSI